MSIATFVIGLGGTGVLTLRALKKLHSELPASERVPAAFLAFDFDRSAQIAGDHKGRFADLPDEEFFYLNPEKLQERLRNIDRGQNGGLAWKGILKWFPDRAKVQIPVSEVEANGASQLRVLGRLGFFENDEVIERMIRLKLNQLGTEVDPSRLSEDKRVVIVSSVAGGTGAGMLIDVAYLARRQLLRPRVYAYLLLPEVFQDVDSGGRIYQNAYACLKELAYLKDQQIPFRAEYERIPPIDVPVAGEEPVARIFLCAGDGFGGADSIKSATCQIAESILGQLQRSIQEKTLAIASNTLSADSQEEQKKRRTHCFSTVTSTVIPLREANLQEAVFDKVVELLRDDDKLQELYVDSLRAFLSKTSRELGWVGRGKEPQSTLKGESSPLPDETPPEVERILDEWRERGLEAVKLDAPRIRSEIESLLQAEESGLAQLPREELEQRKGRLGSLRTLAFDQLASDPLDLKNLVFLPTCESYKRFEKNLPETFKLALFAPEAQLTTMLALQRRALYSLLGSHAKKRLLVPGAAPSESLKKLGEELKKHEDELTRSRRYWLSIRQPQTDLVQLIRAERAALSQAVQDPAFAPNLERVLQARAWQEITTFLDSQTEQATQIFNEARKLWKEEKYQALEAGKIEGLGSLGEQVTQWLKANLPDLLEEARELPAESTAEARRQALSALLAKKLERITELKGPHYVLETDAEKIEDDVRSRLVRSRQRVFEKRTPNPQRKGIALVMLPQGLIWPKGDRDALRRFLEASSAQILAVRSQVEDYAGSRIWIYYEDLFNPPEHIRNVDEYYRTYESQEFKELFHIDRRFLEEPVFKEIHSKHTSIVVVCGNDDCRENISGLPRTQRICPGCGKMIRTRCGNADCTSNSLTQLPEEKRNAKSCPTCGKFNHSAWWCCTQHGKVAIEVPIDKERCPTCLEMHQKDPAGFPEHRISLRPDLADSRACPHCEDLHRKNAAHVEFRIRRDLLPFYLNGVNGHDRETFLRKIVPKYRLPEEHRCPNCRTLLIPVHHRDPEIAPSCGGRPAQ